MGDGKLAAPRWPVHVRIGAHAASFAGTSIVPTQQWRLSKSAPPKRRGDYLQIDEMILEGLIDEMILEGLNKARAAGKAYTIFTMSNSHQRRVP
jgi:hypothetical protein